MHKCIIWGTGNDYDRLYNSIWLQTYKCNMEVTAVVTQKENIYANYIDQIPVICAAEVQKMQFDYIIVCSSRYFDDICKEIQRMGISRNKVIDGRVFEYAGFDYNKYINLIENPVTIISDDCWGGEIYHALSLPFSSPTINIAWKKSEYARFISDLSYYLEQPLQCEREGNFHTGEHPIGALGEGAKKVTMELIHNFSFEEARQQWERRKQRINPDRIFIKFGFDKTDDWELCMEVFDRLQYSKICFFPEMQDKEGYINSGFYKRWTRWNYLKQRVVSYHIEDYIRDSRCTRSAIDILSLLNGEKNYFRDTD